jgi:hypothetical protein
MKICASAIRFSTFHMTPNGSITTPVSIGLNVSSITTDDQSLYSSY